MATLTKTVDKTHVNGSEIFLYTFNVSYSGLTTLTAIGKLVDFVPNKIVYSLPPIGGQLISITQTPVSGGRIIEFNFGTVTAGTSMSFNMACSFGPGRVDKDSYINECDLYADDKVVASSSAHTVKLTLDENFALVKALSEPRDVNIGEEVTFLMMIHNANDPGASITNLTFSDILPPQLLPVLSYLPVGNDNPGLGYSDPTYNGRTGLWVGNTLHFELPSFHGITYTIKFKAVVAPTAIPGELVTNVASWTADGKARNKAPLTFRVFLNEPKAYFVKEAPRFAQLGEEIQYYVGTTNTGTLDLTNLVITDNVPPEVDIHTISGNTATATVNKYSLYIATSDAPTTFKLIANNIIGISPAYSLATFIPAGARVVATRMIIDSMKNLNIQARLYMRGRVNSKATINQSIVNKATLTANSTIGNISVTSQATTILNGKSILTLSKMLSPSLSTYYPLSEFYIVLSHLSIFGMVFTPIFADLLPLGIEYSNSTTDFFIYNSAVDNQIYDSRVAGYPFPLPTKQVIKNYNSTGRTLVRFIFNGMNIQFQDKFLVNFGVFAVLDPPSFFANAACLGNPGSNAVVSESAIYQDVLDIDGDGITQEQLALSNTVSANILSTSEFSLEKWVRGNVTTAYSKSSQVTQGGDISYQLNVTNNQTVELANIEIVDILPYVGDTGVILNTTPRGSEFDVYATESVTAEIINLLGIPVVPPPVIKIEYSISNDPTRFNEAGNGTIGTGNFSNTPPIDITTLRAIKVTTDSAVVLKPYERLIVTITAKAPVGVAIGKTAYNSYAVRADRIVVGAKVPMSPAEPNKVAVTVVTSAKASLGELVWLDTNGNGIYDPTETGVNGIVVELYDSTMTKIKSTVTANDSLGDSGYYTFSNLDEGRFYLKFIPSSQYALTIQDMVDPFGSRPNPTTGLTNVIELAANQNICNENAGLISESPHICLPPTIYAEEKCIPLGGNFDPMTGVKAIDCNGNDITPKVIVKSNDVDTSKAGVYAVKYSVTDDAKQTTTKSITVVVCERSGRSQAINDIIASVALEQTALSHIINAEGEKLHKAVKLNLSDNDMLRINSSITQMLAKIIRLEIVLSAKLDLFEGADNDDDCCSDK